MSNLGKYIFTTIKISNFHTVILILNLVVQKLEHFKIVCYTKCRNSKNPNEFKGQNLIEPWR